jgi:WD40 repeat protein
MRVYLNPADAPAGFDNPDRRQAPTRGALDWSIAGRVSGNDLDLRLWDIGSGVEVRRFSGHCGAITSVAISLDGRLGLSSGFRDHELRLWPVDSGRELCRYGVPHGWLNKGTFSLDGRQAL